MKGYPTNNLQLKDFQDTVLRIYISLANKKFSMWHFNYIVVLFKDFDTVFEFNITFYGGITETYYYSWVKKET